MHPLKNGVVVLEQMPIGNAMPGHAQPHLWEPYRIWMADLYGCRACGHESIYGYGNKPVTEKHRPDFQRWLEKVDVTINDC